LSAIILAHILEHRLAVRAYYNIQDVSWNHSIRIIPEKKSLLLALQEFEGARAALIN
jgi:hypothetical protein